MSLKDFFNKAPSEVIPNKSLNEVGDDIESAGYIAEYTKKQARFVPNLNFRDPSQFAIFGSAKEYYTNAVNHILDEYPYDGSLKERLEWENELPLIEKHVYEREYPRTNGYAQFSYSGWGTAVDFETDGPTVGLSDTPEYVFFRSGPNVDNVYDSATNRETNLVFNPDDGFTVEFWFKKNGFVDYSGGESDLIYLFDAWNGEPRLDDQYGRFHVLLGHKDFFSTAEHILIHKLISGSFDTSAVYTPQINLTFFDSNSSLTAYT